MRHLSREVLKKEFWQLFRFGVIGGLTVVIYFGLYTLASRVLWPSGNRTLESLLANIVSAVFNFFAHRRWTFAAHNDSAGKQIPRFILVAIIAVALQSFLFWIGHAVLHIYDLIVVVAVSALIPLFTYVVHRSFTFRHPVPPAGGSVPGDETL